MPQFDTIIYFTYYINFLAYGFIFFSLINLFVVPFFWNIYYFRYIKKEYNKFYSFLFQAVSKSLLNSTLSLNFNLKLILLVLKNTKFSKKIHFFILKFYILKLIQFLFKI